MAPEKLADETKPDVVVVFVLAAAALDHRLMHCGDADRSVVLSFRYIT